MKIGKFAMADFCRDNCENFKLKRGKRKRWRGCQWRRSGEIAIDWVEVIGTCIVFKKSYLNIFFID